MQSTAAREQQLRDVTADHGRPRAGNLLQGGGHGPQTHGGMAALYIWKNSGGAQASQSRKQEVIKLGSWGLWPLQGCQSLMSGC
jgi:hypothetical protein